MHCIHINCCGEYSIEEPCVGKLQARFCRGGHSNETFSKLFIEGQVL